MKYTRIYADAQGESHFEDVDVSMKPGPANAGKISDLIAATGVMFRLTGEYFIDWHNAPRRQFVVNVTGTVEIVASDGEKRRLGPGSILLAEDLTGKGHTSRGLGGEERLSLFIPLADQGAKR